MNAENKLYAKDCSLDNLKAVMALCIFAAHSTSCFRYIKTPQVISVSYYGSLMVCLTTVLSCFFFLSGYFSRLPDGQTFAAGYRLMVWKKIHSIMIPFLAWNSLYIAVFLIGGLFVPAVKQWSVTLALNTPAGIINTLFGITHHPADGPLWYLRNLFILCLLYPLFRCAAKSIGIFLPVGIFLILSAVNFCFEAPVYIRQYYLMPYSTAAYCLGVVAREKNFSIDTFKKNMWLFIAVGFAATVCYFRIKGIVSREIQFVCENLFVISVLPMWMSLARLFDWQKDSLCGRIITLPAFFIYASHFLCYSVFLHLTAMFIPSSSYLLLILLGIYFGGGIVLMGTGYLMLKKLFPRIFCLLTGNR